MSIPEQPSEPNAGVRWAWRFLMLSTLILMLLKERGLLVSMPYECVFIPVTIPVVVGVGYIIVMVVWEIIKHIRKKVSRK